MSVSEWSLTTPDRSCYHPPMAQHPLKQRLDKLTDAELDELELVLGVTLQETEDHAKWLLTAEGRSTEDWVAVDATTTGWITILSKALGVDPLEKKPQN